MTKVENRAWFLVEDGRAPLYFHVMYDAEKSGYSQIYFKLGKPLDLGLFYLYLYCKLGKPAKEMISRLNF